MSSPVDSSTICKVRPGKSLVTTIGWGWVRQNNCDLDFLLKETRLLVLGEGLCCLIGEHGAQDLLELSDGAFVDPSDVTASAALSFYEKAEIIVILRQTKAAFCVIGVKSNS